jgi:hypothetical protein
MPSPTLFADPAAPDDRYPFLLRLSESAVRLNKQLILSTGNHSRHHRALPNPTSVAPTSPPPNRNAPPCHQHPPSTTGTTNSRTPQLCFHPNAHHSNRQKAVHHTISALHLTATHRTTGVTERHLAARFSAACCRCSIANGAASFAGTADS